MTITVAITGGGGGLGKAFIREFLGAGQADVFTCDISEASLADAGELGAHTFVADLGDRGQVEAWIAHVERQSGGPIDVLVNNAGGTLGIASRLIEDVLDSEWRSVFSANIDATFMVCRAAVPAMKRAGRGRIINISSGAGIAASRTNRHPYTAAKHAIVGLTRQMALELGQFGITVNSVAPGFVISGEKTRREWNTMSEEAKKAHLGKTFMRRVGQVEDIANVVRFLASERSSWITGQVISVDGGTS